MPLGKAQAGRFQGGSGPGMTNSRESQAPPGRDDAHHSAGATTGLPTRCTTVFHASVKG
jgi:hypothetical protein